MQLALKQLVDLDNNTAVSTSILLTIPAGHSILLHHVSWQAFEHLLSEMGETRAARVAYDQGILEIMSPLPRHDYFKESVGILVQDFAYEMDIDYESLGSTTWQRRDLLAALEPDNCFYFQNEPLIRGKIDLKLPQDPPPDLALEIDITSKSLSRMPIYAKLGVPEV